MIYKKSLLRLSFFFPFLISLNLITSSNFFQKEVKVSELFNIQEINDIQITNYNTHKTWHLTKQSLSQLKSILEKSIAIKNAVFLKPGHMAMVVSFNKKTKRSFYMYNDGIYNDSQNYTSKTNFPFSIKLSKYISWENFK